MCFILSLLESTPINDYLIKTLDNVPSLTQICYNKCYIRSLFIPPATLINLILKVESLQGGWKHFADQLRKFLNQCLGKSYNVRYVVRTVTNVVLRDKPRTGYFDRSFCELLKEVEGGSEAVESSRTFYVVPFHPYYNQDTYNL